MRRPGQQPPEPFPPPPLARRSLTPPERATAGLQFRKRPWITQRQGQWNCPDGDLWSHPWRGADQESGDLRSGDGRGRETRQHGETRQHAEADADGESSAVSEYADQVATTIRFCETKPPAPDDSRNPEDQGPPGGDRRERTSRRDRAGECGRGKPARRRTDSSAPAVPPPAMRPLAELM